MWLSALCLDGLDELEGRRQLQKSPQDAIESLNGSRARSLSRKVSSPPRTQRSPERSNLAKRDFLEPVMVSYKRPQLSNGHIATGRISRYRIERKGREPLPGGANGVVHVAADIATG